MFHRLDLVEHLTARLTGLQVVVALLGLLEGEAAVDLEKRGESRGQVPSGRGRVGRMRSKGGASRSLKRLFNVLVVCACVTTIATDVDLIGNEAPRG